MHQKTLLLNQGYQPIKAISWKRAICMFFLEKVEVLESYDWKIKSAHKKWDAPAVVRLRYNTRVEPMRIRFSRGNIYARDKKICQYCNQKFAIKELTMDHVIPRSVGGRTSWTNIVTACETCNKKKADRTPQQADMKLIGGKPQYPSVQMLYSNSIGGDIPYEWNNWLR